eukprot:gene2507-3253_t
MPLARADLMPLSGACAVAVAIALSRVTAHIPTPSLPAVFNVEWSEPSPGPGQTIGGKKTYMDAMPLGNGRVTALAWANVTTGGVGIYLGSQEAMSGQTELLKLGHVQVSLTPNPWSPGAHFRQRLDLAAGTVVVELGAAVISVWVDANSDTLRVTAQGPTPFAISARASSTRPSTPWAHAPGSSCQLSTTNPDVYMDPLPAEALRLAPLPPNPHPFRHASGGQRPLRSLGADRLSGLAPFKFAPGTVISYHRNNVSEGDTLEDLFTQQVRAAPCAMALCAGGCTAPCLMHP